MPRSSPYPSSASSSSELALCGREALLADLGRFGAHALLLVAPDGVGREVLAKQLAIAWGGLLPPYPDLHGYEAPFGIDHVRALKVILASRPFAATTRVVLVERAERLSPVVQNAFLRVVEEPPDHARFVFSTSTPAALLPTLRSRFVALRVPPLPEAAFHRCLAGIVPGAIDPGLYQAAHGWPVRALAILEQRGRRPEPGPDGPAPFFATWASIMAKDPEEALRSLRQQLEGHLQETGEDRYRTAMLAVDAARVRLARNQQPLLVLENLALDLEPLGLLQPCRPGLSKPSEGVQPVTVADAGAPDRLL